MSERKIVVTEGMLKAASESGAGCGRESCRLIMEAALRWLANNPIVPTEQQAAILGVAYATNEFGSDYHGALSRVTIKWQHLMFLAPEQDDPDPEKTRFREALEKLAKLGNGDSYGNSQGNEIAQEALGVDRRNPGPPQDEDLADRIFKAVGPLGYTPTHAELDKIWEHIFRAGHGWTPPELRNRGDDFGERMNDLTVEVNRLGMSAAIEILQRTS